jgi:hypothetical protein
MKISKSHTANNDKVLNKATTKTALMIAVNHQGHVM